MVVWTGEIEVPVFRTASMCRTVLFLLHIRCTISELGMDDEGISVFSDSILAQNDNQSRSDICLLCLLTFSYYPY